MGVAGATLAVGAAGIASSQIAGANSSSAASSAAAAQAAADQNAAGQQYQALGGISSALSPYTNLGTNATNALSGVLSQDSAGSSSPYLADATAELGYSEGYTQDAANIYGTLQNGISQQTLDNTPGYQFTLQQGLESTQNSAAARGLANSGAALKGAATYATGLANDTYQNQYNDLLSTAQGYSGLAQNETNVAGASLNSQASLLDTNNQILSAAQLGENAANQYGEYASQAAGNAGSDVSGAGAATASGITGAASAYNNALTGSSNALYQSLLLNKLLSSSSGAGSSATGGTTYTPSNPTADYSALFPNG